MKYMKWYDIQLDKVVLIGDFPYFEDINTVRVCSMGYGYYRGIEIQKRGFSGVCDREVYKNKPEAVERAKRYYANNAKYSKFSDGTIPFEIVLYLRGGGWQIYSSNTFNNDRLIQKKIEKCSQYK